MAYEGYFDDNQLPFKRGQQVVIPAGVRVRSMAPNRKEYVTARKQTVTLHRCDNGMSIANYIAYGDKDYYNPLKERGFDFSAIEKMRADNSPEYYKGSVPVMNPSVFWAGAGGYWCWVDINDILEANNVHELAA